ncbi:unnamed protein product [Ascophyllum nodosum]
MNAGAHILRKEDFPASVCREFFQPSPRPRACSRSRRYSCASFPSKMIMAPLFRLYCCGTSVHLLMMLGFAAGGRERQGFRLLVPTPTVPRIEAASNMDRFRPVLGGVGRTYLAAFAPPPQLIKLQVRLHRGARDSVGQPAAHQGGARRVWCAPCRGIAGPAPWKSHLSRDPMSSYPTAARREQERRGRTRWGVLSGQASAQDGDRRRFSLFSKKSAAFGADVTNDDGAIMESSDGILAQGDEGGRKDSRGGWVKKRWQYAWAKIKKEPFQILTIPISAALVGWITNKLAVEMIFHPLVWRGIPLRVIEGQPFGLIGWQGIVPAKAGVMAERMVDMVTTQLVNVEEIFRRLSPGKVARLLGPEINKIVHSVFDDLAPRSLSWLPEGFGRGLPYQAVDELKGLRRSMLVGLTKDMQEHVHKVLDLKDMVVGEMLRDRSLMVSLFQQCGKAEFAFLVNSGFFFGFLLGLVQMFVWLVYDKPWILPAGGAVVGYLTNWLAIKLIFEPVDPIKVGPFVLQGLFLKRQNEVAADFAEFFANNVLTSQKLWRSMLDGSRAEAFRELVTGRVVPFVSRASAVAGANLDPVMVKSLAARAVDKLRDHVHVLHDYTDQRLALKEIMTVRMQKMSTRTFEGVLHPVFQEEEFTLIIAGAILGAFAGFLQMLLSTKSVREAAKVAAAKAAETAVKAADGVVEAGGELVGGVVGGAKAPVQVVQAAQKTAVGWKKRTTHTAKRCTSSACEVVRTLFLSLFAAARGVVYGVTGTWRRRLRGSRHGSDCTAVPSESPDANSPTTAPSESGDS